MIPLLVVLAIVGVFALSFLLQALVERDSLPPVDPSAPKKEYEIAKLAAEIRRIRSDTYGSLFWLRAVALFVTVGSVVGGYLIGQSKTTRDRLKHEQAIEDERLRHEQAIENRRNVDEQYQALVQELSDNDSPLLRAAAAVKLGHVLRTFPPEWHVDQGRQEQLIDLTKRVLATALAIEENERVRKTLTSALVLHKPWDQGPQEGYADLQGIDFSVAKADDAYWARVDFSRADFYRAHMNTASLRKSKLHYAQLRETDLRDAVLVEADCEEANFKLADLRKADLSKTSLVGTNFEGARVNGTILTGAKVEDVEETQRVDTSEAGDGSDMRTVREWLSHHDLDFISQGGEQRS